jgi:hypothetical protein|tara:strand:- start:437 stop:697 length:261 start_codon:yes stop_codon:yes gene_type:complete
VPVDVVESQRGDVTDPKAKLAHQEEHGVVTAAQGRRLVYATQKALLLVNGQVLRKSGFAPLGHARDSIDEMPDGVSTEDKIPEKAA